MSDQWPWIAGVLATIVLVVGIAVFDSKSKPPTSGTVEVPAEVSTVNQDEKIKGKLDAPVTLIEYADFQCPACGRYYPMVKQLVEEKADTVRVVFRHLPLRAVHKNADAAARAAEAANKQGKFFEMHDKLFENQTAWSELEDTGETFEQYATIIGLNVDQFKSDLGSDQVRDAIEADEDTARQAGAESTPTFILNGQKLIQNPQSVDEFKALIDQANTTNNEAQDAPAAQ